MDLFLYGYVRIYWSMLPSVTHMHLQSTPYMTERWANELEAAGPRPNICYVEFIQELGRGYSNKGVIEPLIQKRIIMTR
jgi:hypothetical protein